MPTHRRSLKPTHGSSIDERESGLWRVPLHQLARRLPPRPIHPRIQPTFHRPDWQMFRHRPKSCRRQNEGMKMKKSNSKDRVFHAPAEIIVMTCHRHKGLITPSAKTVRQLCQFWLEAQKQYAIVQDRAWPFCDRLSMMRHRVSQMWHSRYGQAARQCAAPDHHDQPIQQHKQAFDPHHSDAAKKFSNLAGKMPKRYRPSLKSAVQGYDHHNKPPKTDRRPDHLVYQATGQFPEQ